MLCYIIYPLRSAVSPFTDMSRATDVTREGPSEGGGRFKHHTETSRNRHTIQ